MIRGFNPISKNVLETNCTVLDSYSIKIKEQTRKLAAGCSKHRFEVADETDEVSSKHRFEVADRTDKVRSKHRFEVADRTDEVSHIYNPRQR